MLFEEISSGFYLDDCGSRNGDKTEVTLVRGIAAAEKDIRKWLSLEEQSRYEQFGSQKRKGQYLLGRIAAKIAIKRLITKNPEIFSLPSSADIAENEVVIGNLENGAPKITKIHESLCNFLQELGISIGHSNDFATAVAFLKPISCGIDVEKISASKIRALQKVQLSGETLLEENAENLTVAWCLKESLSKALGTGFAQSFENFRIKELEYIKPKKEGS